MALRCLLGRRSLLVSVKPQRNLGFRGGGGGGGGFTVRNYSEPETVEGLVDAESHPFGVFPRPDVVRYFNPNIPFRREDWTAGGVVPYGGSLSDPEVIKASLSAIKQYNKRQNKKLEFVGLLKASVQVVCGRKYYLTLMVLDADVVNKYEVEITRDASKMLESFKLVADSHEI